MTYKMTPERAKALTEMIGECRHEPDRPSTVGVTNSCKGILYSKCKKCGVVLTSSNARYADNRTFTTDKDMIKVFRWLVDNGKWRKVFSFLENMWWEKEEDGEDLDVWLHYDSERFCVLVAMALEEGVI